MYEDIKQVEQDLTMTREAYLEFMMKEYGDKIIQLVYLIVKDQNMAEDITQEVFLKAFRGLHSFRGESNVKTWLYRIAINEAKKYLRSWSFRRIFSTFKKEEVFHNQYEQTEQRVEETVIGKLTKAEMAERVMALSPSYRQIILLHYYEDFTVKEIAEVLEISAEAVRTKLYRARMSFKSLLEKEGLEWM
ncbi:sigma-70 family RNA polymerase sigma factor [Brevibacillus laterosporus]|uniref:RNA polymerase sigma factor n=1 Tax=Brevibacillus laterosporus TaxID=1465 RepID=A0AAP3DIC4_BRELA|nr:sigma-70 family RNA polymerase sigma factor [Brevibacillus laterosporus]MCR8981518.1 sigma-70 family RNA polymerase sigma factor [Brevibacillus laterosporus]MCZ0808673.1 sigma-70 family RNA polymerase sigma factor [Brevibacillus laterosporus]MCZ0827135.1 sigma-70 family RNA polymerase sigma factor [Brevibacillus laterosporus]MCZ0850843.1 sigma-70 family RNA polymerase sigma factor [Brevibacillus laterosporus]